MLDQEFETSSNRNNPRVLRQISDFDSYENVVLNEFKPKFESSKTPKVDMSYTFRPEPEIIEMRRLKEKVDRLEQAYEESTERWKQCQTVCNAYFSTYGDDDNKENVFYSNLIQSKKKPCKFQKAAKSKVIQRPSSSCYKSVRSRNSK